MNREIRYRGEKKKKPFSAIATVLFAILAWALMGIDSEVAIQGSTLIWCFCFALIFTALEVATCLLPLEQASY